MHEVSAGFFSFTEVTDPGQHRAFNAWHMLDHLPEQYRIPGIAFGQRWVASPACREARLACDPALAETHYVTCYHLCEPLEETLQAFYALAGELGEQERFFEHRRGLLGGCFRVTGRRAHPRVLVSDAVVPYRPQRGVLACVLDPRGDPEELAAWIRSEHVPVLHDLPGAAGSWSFRGEPSPDRDAVFALPNAPGRQVVLLYLDGDPLAAAEALAARPAHLEALRQSAEPRYLGPLETIQVGAWDWFDAPGS